MLPPAREGVLARCSEGVGVPPSGDEGVGGEEGEGVPAREGGGTPASRAPADSRSSITTAREGERALSVCVRA